MTDRELLELAAKAVGNGAQWDCPERGMMVLTPDGNDTMTWNPLASDGDALRLALKLGVLLEVRYTDPALQRHNRVTYWIDPAHGLHVAFDDFGTNLAAAARRAIVRAAAEIGRAMP